MPSSLIRLCVNLKLPEVRGPPDTWWLKGGERGGRGALRGRVLEGDTSKASTGPGECFLTGRKSDSYTTDWGSNPKFCAKLSDRLTGVGEYVVWGCGGSLLGGCVWLWC